ncbi:asparaginase [Vibrio sp. RC27]
MTRKHIYIAYTGGTIGMQKSDHGFVPVAGYMKKQLESMPEFHRSEMPHYTIHEYDPLIDSSDMSPKDWQQIADDIRDNYEKYDGFVILHGTDTMAFTASALSFMLENLGKPLIVTGSQIPLAQLRSDGQANLLNALHIAANYPINEVTLFFNNQLMRGNRSTKSHADGFSAFTSPNLPALLEAGINIKLSSGVQLNEPAPAPFKVSRIIPQPIGVITMYPGISHEVIRNTLQQPVNAMILLTFGVGNAPQNPQLLAQLKEASDRGVIVINLTQCLAGKVNMGGYATGCSLADAGVISGYDMTPEAALAKLHYLLSKELGYEEVKRQMQLVLRGEMSL